MTGHGVLADAELLADIAGRQTIRRVADQQTNHGQAGFLA